MYHHSPLSKTFDGGGVVPVVQHNSQKQETLTSSGHTCAIICDTEYTINLFILSVFKN